MGATQSFEQEQQRKVTVENSDAMGVIQISDSVAERLRSYQQSPPPSPASKPASPPSSPSRSPPPELKDRHAPPSQKTTQPPLNTDLPKMQEKPAYQQHNPAHKHTDADLQAAVRKVEDFYRKKLEEAERIATSTVGKDSKDKSAWQRVYLKELEEATREVERKFSNYSYSPVCQDYQHKVLQCYRANPNRTLECTKEADEFMGCVAEYRKKMLNVR